VEGRAIIAFDLGELDLARRYAAEAVKLFSGSVNYGCTAHALKSQPSCWHPSTWPARDR
jgi:hypothetical protein